MPTLSDGTPIKIQDETYEAVLQAFEDAFDDNDQEVLAEVKGYVSKSTGRVIDITLDVAFEYKQLLTEAILHVSNYPLDDVDTDIASAAEWRQARTELRRSLLDSLQDQNKADHTSRSAEGVLDCLPSIRVGYSSGCLQLQGVTEEYTIVKEGEEKTRNSRPKTLAKNEILQGTFRDSDAIGALKTLALEKGRFDSLTIGGVTFTSDDFFTAVKDDAIRVFTGVKGHSKRVVLSKAGDQALIELNDVFASYEVAQRYTHTGKPKKVSAIRTDLGVGADPIALAEVMVSKKLKTETLIATEGKGALEIKEVAATKSSPYTVGPSPASKTFVEVKRENKQMKKGETLLFVKPKSSQLIANLDWDNKQDLDLNCFVELNNGYTVALQPIDKRFGAIDYAPYVLHSGDDRHGNSEEGEFLHVEIGNLKHIKRMVFYATIYSGASNWSDTDAVFTLSTPGYPTVEVPLNEYTTNFGEDECVLCTVSVDGNQLSVDRHVTFHQFKLIQHDGRTTCPMDVAYNFGMTWRYGSKD
jgi:uncharacterized protein involved in tellurium resistance